MAGMWKLRHHVTRESGDISQPYRRRTSRLPRRLQLSLMEETRAPRGGGQGRIFHGRGTLSHAIALWDRGTGRHCSV